MSTKELGKDLAHQSEVKRDNLLIILGTVVSISYFVAESLLPADYIWYFNPIMIFKDDLEVALLYFSVAGIILLFSYVYFFYNGKLKPILDIPFRLLMLEGTGRFKDLSKKLFYQQPEKVDGLKRQKGKLTLFCKKQESEITRLFDFEEGNKTTARIVRQFRSNAHYLDLFKIIEGYLNEGQYDAIYDFSTDTKKHKQEEIDKRRRMYRAYTDGTVFFSPALMKTELNYVTKDFDRYLKANLTRATRVNKQIRTMTKQERNKLVDAFAFVYFHRLITNFTNIPTGLVESKLDNYDFRRIINNYQVEGFTIELNNDNNGKNKSFSDDTFTSIFLTLYNGYIKDGSSEVDAVGILKKFDPLADVEEERPTIELDFTVKDIEPDTVLKNDKEEN